MKRLNDDYVRDIQILKGQIEAIENSNNNNESKISELSESKNEVDVSQYTDIITNLQNEVERLQHANDQQMNCYQNDTKDLKQKIRQLKSELAALKGIPESNPTSARSVYLYIFLFNY